MNISASEFFSPEEKEDIDIAIKNAELDSSCEIRVHVENICEGDVMKRANEVFLMLEIHKPRQRNGILFYLAIQNRKFAVIGDTGVNEVVPEHFWELINMNLRNHLRESDFTHGICESILMLGEELKKHFPYNKGDMNELPDAISFGNN
jgi:uncharacterized membrane protein